MRRATCPPLEAAGYVLSIREPDWHEHRMFKGPDTNVNDVKLAVSQHIPVLRNCGVRATE